MNALSNGPLVNGTSLAVGPMIDVIGIVQGIAADIVAVRASRGLTPLVCDASSPTFPILVGQEQAARMTSPPRIVFVPSGIRTEPASRLGVSPPLRQGGVALVQTGKVSQLPARPFGTRGSASTSSCGATRTRAARTRWSTSTRRSSCTGSSLAPSTGPLAARPAFVSAMPDGSRRRTIAASVDSSRSRSRSLLGSPTSHTSFSRMPIQECRVSAPRSTSMSRPCPQQAGRRSIKAHSSPTPHQTRNLRAF